MYAQVKEHVLVQMTVFVTVATLVTNVNTVFAMEWTKQHLMYARVKEHVEVRMIVFVTVAIQVITVS